MNALRTSSVRPQVEALEDRAVPTTATFNGGVLRVFGTNLAETIRITQSGTRVTVQGVGYANNVSSIVVEGYGGNDTIDLRATSVASTIYGGDGNDFIVGSKAADSIFAGYGNDKVWGMEGNDSISGEVGNDLLFGWTGNDALYGGDGNDFLDDGNRTSQEYADGGYGWDFNADVVAVNGATYSDIRQQGAPTCSFLSSLSGLARTGTNFTQWIRYVGPTAQGMPQYEVAFWRNGWVWTKVDFDGSMTGQDPAISAEGESWTVLMQRGWIRFAGGNGSAWPHTAIYGLTGRTTAAQYSVSDADFSRMTTFLSQNKLVILATRDATPSTGLLVRNHAYTVMATWNGGGSNLWVQVRNPWGVDGGSLTDGDAYDGLVWVRWADVKASMGYLGIA